MNLAAMFWSGGKDSSLALYEIQKNYPHLQVKYLVTTINAEYRRISMHGVRETLLEKQSELIGIPLWKMLVPNVPDNSTYETCLHQTLTALKGEGISHIVFGDIFLEDLKAYRLSILAQHELTSVFPLWQRSTKVLIADFITLKFKTITCCISTESLTEDWVGKLIDAQFVSELDATVDPCGENGEFHTFCFDGPIFRKPVSYHTGEKKYVPLHLRSTSQAKEIGFWYIDLLPS